MAPFMEAKDRSRTGEEGGNPAVIALTHNQAPRWKKFLATSKSSGQFSSSEESSDGFKKSKARPAKSSLGILNDRETEEVPGA